MTIQNFENYFIDNQEQVVGGQCSRRRRRRRGNPNNIFTVPVETVGETGEVVVSDSNEISNFSDFGSIFTYWLVEFDAVLDLLSQSQQPLSENPTDF